MTRHGRHIDVAQAVLLVTHVPLGLQHAQLGAHGRVAGRAGHRLEDFGGGRPPQPVERVHDLALALGQHCVSP